MKTVLYTAGMSVLLPDSCRRDILEHCRRALEEFHSGRSDEGKAFGLVFGRAGAGKLLVTRSFPLRRNVRSKAPWCDQIDRVMHEHAVPSVTPLARRGWVADPAELLARIRECRPDGDILLGTYHMHRVGWEHDPVRDTPTKLDAVLAEDSGLLMFIVSMVRPEQPLIRVFYEGVLEKEFPLTRG